MKAYILSALERLKEAPCRIVEISPRWYSGGETVVIMTIAVTYEGRTFGVRGDKLDDFLRKTRDELVEKMTLDLVCVKLKVIECANNDYYYANGIVDPELLKDQLLPMPPVFYLTKPRAKLKACYGYTSHYLWASVSPHPGNPVLHEENNPCYLDVEYFLYYILHHENAFERFLPELMNALLPYLDEDIAFAQYVTERLIHLHYAILQYKQDLEGSR